MYIGSDPMAECAHMCFSAPQKSHFSYQPTEQSSGSVPPPSSPVSPSPTCRSPGGPPSPLLLGAACGGGVCARGSALRNASGAMDFAMF